VLHRSPQDGSSARNASALRGRGKTLKEWKLRDAPADVTVGRGSRSREDRNDIKNGASARLFTAVSALFDVSLCFDSSDQITRQTQKKKKTGTATPRACLQHFKTHERHHKMVMTFSANSYTTFCAFSGAVFGDSIYCAKIDEI
jgi:hypothetical protein